MRVILAIAILGLHLLCKGQSQLFSAATLREDLTFLKESIERYNPALYQYNHKGQFHQLFNEIYESLDSPLTRLEFFKAVSLLVAGANEGHFVVGSANNKATQIYSGFFDGTFKYLPLSLVFVDNRAYITGNFSADSSLQKGWELLEINNEKITGITERLLPFIPADGDILTAKYYRLNNNFPALYYWYIDQPVNFALKVLPKDSNKPFTVNVPACNRDSMVYRANKRYGIKSKQDTGISEFYELKLERGLAILRLKTFNRQLTEKYGIKAKKLYRSIFQELADKHIQTLVIDLRDNGGGRREFVKQIVPYFLREKTTGILFESVSYSGKVKTYPMPDPSPYAFTGKVYVLINAGSFSNGSVVAAFAREFADAVIIGQESASRYEGFAAGSSEYVHLPNTLIQIQIPRYWLKYGHRSRQNTSNRGVMPDYEVHYSIDDILSKKDKEVEKVKVLMNGK